MSARVLVVSSDAPSTELLTSILASRGYTVRTVDGAAATLSTVKAWRPGLAVVDVERPLMDGVEMCERIREASPVPIIVVSESADWLSEVAALDSGADDYIAKPYGADKLLARVRAALRRSGEVPEALALGIGEFQIDFHERRVRVNGQPVRLTPKEFDLFVFMARNPNRVIPHKTLLGAVWGEASADQAEYLRVFVGQLRKKFESDPSHPRYLVTEPWVGYRFNPTGLA
jgi:two-component system KDP operon response regulator KdpE